MTIILPTASRKRYVVTWARSETASLLYQMPKISIYYNKFLDPIFIGWIQSQKKYSDWQPPELQEVNGGVLRYRKIWSQYEERVLKAICNVTGFSYVRNQIDVHVVSGNPRAFSFPIVLKCRYTDDEFIEVLSHELIHCLFHDNNKKVKFVHMENTHILIHAILKYIFIDVIKEPRLIEDDIARSLKAENRQYAEAWNTVGRLGHMKIIDEYRSENGLQSLR